MEVTRDVQHVIAALTAKPVALDVAKPQLPKAGGVYAWWIVDNALAGLPANRHPSESDLHLLYLGAAPDGPTSASTLRSLVVGNHMRGNIAASTLRRTLAALLLDQLALTPIKNGTKVRLSKEQNTQLSQWQQQHLRLTWHPVAKPWLVESAVVAALRPPLNLADHQNHPFYATVATARQKLHQAAR